MSLSNITFDSFTITATPAAPISTSTGPRFLFPSPRLFPNNRPKLTEQPKATSKGDSSKSTERQSTPKKGFVRRPLKKNELDGLERRRRQLAIIDLEQFAPKDVLESGLFDDINRERRDAGEDEGSRTASDSAALEEDDNPDKNENGIMDKEEGLVAGTAAATEMNGEGESSDEKEEGSDEKEEGSDEKEDGSDEKEGGSDEKEGGSDEKEGGSDQNGEDNPDKNEKGIIDSEEGKTRRRRDTVVENRVRRQLDLTRLVPDSIRNGPILRQVFPPLQRLLDDVADTTTDSLRIRRDALPGPIIDMATLDDITTLALTALETESCARRQLCETGRVLQDPKSRMEISFFIKSFVHKSLTPLMKVFEFADGCENIFCPDWD